MALFSRHPSNHDTGSEQEDVLSGRNAIQEIYAIKAAIVFHSGLWEPLLHVIIGFLIYVLVLLLVSSPWIAFGAVMAVQLLNEVNDYLVKGRAFLDVLPSSLLDTAVTVFLPLVMIWLSRTGWRRLAQQPFRSFARDSRS